jgi:hypothetical protein
MMKWDRVSRTCLPSGTVGQFHEEGRTMKATAPQGRNRIIGLLGIGRGRGAGSGG